MPSLISIKWAGRRERRIRGSYAIASALGLIAYVLSSISYNHRIMVQSLPSLVETKAQKY